MTEDNLKYSPTCNLCNERYKENFDSSAWIQYYSKKDKPQGKGVNQTAPQLRWICPQCSEDIGYMDLQKELEQTKEESDSRIKLISRIQNALSVLDELAQEKRQGI